MNISKNRNIIIIGAIAIILQGFQLIDNPLKRKNYIKIINSKHKNDKVDFAIYSQLREPSIYLTIPEELVLSNNFYFIEIHQGNDEVFWCRDSFEYVIDINNQVAQFICLDSVSQNETRFFHYLMEKLYPRGYYFPEELRKQMQLCREGRLMDYTQELYEKKKLILDEYHEKHPVSNVFKEICQNIFIIEKLENLLFIYNRSLEKQIDMDVLPKLEEQLLNYKHLYQDDNLLFSLAFRIGCRSYNNFLVMRETHKKPELMEEYLSVKNNFKGQVKDYLLYSIYRQMMDKHDLNLTRIDFDTDCENELLKNDIGDVIYMNKLAKNSASDILVRQDSSIIKFADIIKQHEGKVIYVDFWASWCEPCRKCLPASRMLHEEYEGKDIVFVYISKDKNYSSWIEACKQEKIDSNVSYLLVNPSFTKTLNITGIPHYLLFDRQGNLVDRNAPRPDSEEIRDKIDSLLEVM
ncbi:MULTISPECIES: TlpA family protein disulfide reductase [Odoribacteraceae]|uniref:TlpA family protein disulfide reductase n=1 Tax=Odoribacteraceae TaxID=1853231 RepID=UPI000E492F84|nr:MULTISPECIES: thioredoxin-like domain-containing protein [Odoribacteraceae]MCQ4874008.1 thioredoxin-like domain-containing protein [Butyricimonas paravirosa]RHR82956.1 hypothetical protein DWW52_03605 [Odoribacter sp. AF15-53]